MEVMELSQKQFERVKQNITDAMLVAMATEAFLNVERYLKADDNWEEKDYTDYTCENWKVLYLKVDVKDLLNPYTKGKVENFRGAFFF